MSYPSEAHECLTDKSKELCEEALRLARLSTPNHEAIAAVNIELLREHKKHMTSKKMIDRTEETIAHLRKLNWERKRKRNQRRAA